MGAGRWFITPPLFKWRRPVDKPERTEVALERIAEALEGLLDIHVAMAKDNLRRGVDGTARDVIHLMSHRQRAEVASADYAARAPRPTPSTGERRG